jgi:hypothetical protein
VLDSPIVRNAVAAALASAAAALLYRKSTKVNDGDDVDWSVDTEVADYQPPQAKRSTARKVRRKAADAANTASVKARAAVSKAAKSEMTQAARAAVKKTAKAAVEKTAKAAVARTVEAITGTRPESKSAVLEESPTEASLGLRPRRTRSDTGSARKSRKTRPEVGAAGMLGPGVAGEAEASADTLGSTGASTVPESKPASPEEHLVESNSN